MRITDMPQTPSFQQVKIFFVYLAILLVFIISWGITEFGLLYSNLHAPNTISSFFDFIRDIIALPYYQMFGEFYLEKIMQAEPFDMDVGDCSLCDYSCYNATVSFGDYSKVRCTNPGTRWLAYILLMFYMLLTSIIMVNVVIALFNTKYDKYMGINIYLDSFMTVLRILSNLVRFVRNQNLKKIYQTINSYQ